MTRKEILKHNVVMLSGYYESQGASYHFKECYMKVCTKCGVEKDESEFLKRANGSFRTGCKSCRKEYNFKNKDKKKEYNLNYYKDNKEVIDKTNKEWFNNNKDKQKEYTKKWRDNNKDKTHNIHELWYIKNRKEKIQKSINYAKNRKNKDPYFKFKGNLRSIINQAFKLYSKNGKTKSCKEYGIDFESIFNHIGYKDDPTMHLDHIIPLSVFDLDNPEHVRLAHLPENLRWLDATENRIKSDNIDMQLIRCSLGLTLIAQEIGLI